MVYRRLTRDRTPIAALAFGLLLLLGYVVDDAFDDGGAADARARQLLVTDPWYCEVRDPHRQALVSTSVETFHESGTLHGRTTLEDRGTGRVLLDFSYRGFWEFDDPWLTEAIEDYEYLHVDRESFSADQLAAIEAEFGEPEVSRVHALTRGQLIYGAHQSLYQCHRRAPASNAVAALDPSAEAARQL